METKSQTHSFVLQILLGYTLVATAMECNDCTPRVSEGPGQLCTTDFVSDQKSLPLTFNFQPDYYDILCLLSGVRVATAKSGFEFRHGCQIYFDDSTWKIDVQRDCQCRFMCIAHVREGRSWKGEPIARRQLIDTTNALDVVSIRRRIVYQTESVDEDHVKKYKYETFCGLSGYGMALIPRQETNGASDITGSLNGYCQLSVDEEWWRGAAWARSESSQCRDRNWDCHSFCSVNCAYVTYAKDKNMNGDYGLMITHSLYESDYLIKYSNSPFGCSLAYVNIQPDLSEEEFGCTLLVVDKSIGSGTTEWWWKIEINGSNGTVRCGAVCTCETGSDYNWDCIVPEDNGEESTKKLEHKDVEQPSRYHLLLGAFSVIVVWVIKVLLTGRNVA